MSKLRFKYKEVISSVKSKTPVPQGKQRFGKEHNLPIVIEGVQISRVTLPKEKGGGKDMPIGTSDSIRKQLLLKSVQFSDFVNCPMTISDYISIMKDKFSDYFS